MSITSTAECFVRLTAAFWQLTALVNETVQSAIGSVSLLVAFWMLDTCALTIPVRFERIEVSFLSLAWVRVGVGWG